MRRKENLTAMVDSTASGSIDASVSMHVDELTKESFVAPEVAHLYFKDGVTQKYTGFAAAQLSSPHLVRLFADVRFKQGNLSLDPRFNTQYTHLFSDPRFKVRYDLSLDPRFNTHYARLFSDPRFRPDGLFVDTRFRKDYEHLFSDPRFEEHFVAPDVRFK
jgi:hypothetical protein